MWTEMFTDVQVGFRKGRRTRDQIANIRWIIEKAREFQKNIYFYFIDYIKTFDCVDHYKLWRILLEMGIPDHLTWLLRNPYAGQEATVRIWHRTMDWFQIGKGVGQGCIFPSCLFNSEKAMATHSSTLAWKMTFTEETGRLWSMGSLRVGHDWVTSLSCIGEGNGNPLQCPCLENPRDSGAWWAAVYGVSQSWTRWKWLSSSSSLFNLFAEIHHAKCRTG